MTIELLERAPTSAISERELVRGYSGAATRLVVEPCACGEAITSASTDPPDVMRAVGAHNVSTVHRQWRERREAEAAAGGES